ncbi:MAG: flagellar hook-basal body complex protein FliE [bacterium]|nr:flagellar hook-basal body complex protein FliE [bacterium]
MEPTRLVPGLPPTIEGPDYKKNLGKGLGLAEAGGQTFGQLLEDSLTQVNSLQQQADVAITDLASGGPTTLHDTMIALEKADLSFRLMMQVRNKIVEAYQEIVRMQV